MDTLHVMLAADARSWAGTALTMALMLGLALASAACSASEATLFSLTRSQLELAATSTNPLRRLVPRVMRQPKQTLMIILLANTAVNTLLFAISYVFFAGLAAHSGAWITPASAIGSVLLVLILGEVVPKILAVRSVDRLAPLAATFVRSIGTVAGPIARVIDLVLAGPLARVLLGGAAAREAPGHNLSTEELKALLHLSRRSGDIDRIEDSFLREIIDLGSTRVRDVMVPRVEVVACDVSAPPERLRELVRTTRRKKVPVYSGSMDNIVGLVYAKVLFLNPDRRLKDLVVPVRFVPELATCEHLLHHFRQTKTQLAIAVDEYGGMAGLVTLEDVLEEIVGEISTPEEQPTEPEIRPLSDTEYDISGRLDVRYWAETFHLPRRTENVATVGGLVTARLGRPAQVGDTVRLSNVELKVASVQRRRIERLRLRLLDPAQREATVG